MLWPPRRGHERKPPKPKPWPPRRGREQEPPRRGHERKPPKPELWPPGRGRGRARGKKPPKRNLWPPRRGRERSGCGLEAEGQGTATETTARWHMRDIETIDS